MKTGRIVSVFSILITTLLYISCSKELDDNQILKITEIQTVNPIEGKAETEVIITGTNFGTDVDKISLFFNETEAEISSITETSITTIVPRGASTGKIKIIKDGKEIEGPEFNYILTPAQLITIAGQVDAGDIVGPIEEASFDAPIGIIKDSQGTIYISDFRNNKIKKIDSDLTSVSILAGSTVGNMVGTGTEAMFKNPRLIVFDTDENIIVSDQGNNQIKKITPEGTVTTIAGTGVAGFDNGLSSVATFRNPMGIVVDNQNNIFVSDFSNNSIRKIQTDGQVITIAGSGAAGDVNGVGTTAQFNNPVDISLDSEGNIYVADYRNHKIKKISPDGTVTTVAGSGIAGDIDGTVNESQFNLPQDVLIASDGTIYIADTINHKIKKISDGMVTTIAGTGESGNLDGEALAATLFNPRELFLDEENGELYITTEYNIRKLILAF
ncbi:IPT/TIG domain-containing protein [Aquimarina sp. MMG016]|uniref:NHL domain-containing protein n=1 Tax=Aquimarina sp. MMG016 TaxID=2822690 RepID=UPI001B39F5B9|nr:IPT/TIG domain-containing protein [Aquimarina sp. MMG016]MBQ4818950.1 IPT/TIG domain-containing protein [Aquimarina sp. MMG016]